MMFDTSFEKKTLYGAIWAIFLGVLLLIYPFFVSAGEDSIIDEDFSGFSNGALDGQGNWTTILGSGDISEIQESVVKSNKAIHIKGFNPTSGKYTLPAPSIDRVKFRFWFRTDTLDVEGGNDDQSTSIDMYFDDISHKYIKFCHTSNTTRSILASNVAPSNNTCVGGVGTINANVWALVEVEFNPSENFWRARVDESAWSEAVFTADYMVYFSIRMDWDNDENVYFDDFGSYAGVCDLGSCSACEIYDTCVEAGCQWYYSEQMYLLFGQGGYCIEPQEPSEEECGAFYKCQFCIEELCGTGSLEGFCEWVDKGAGFACYMTEPEIPPEQVQWEAPTLENCDELSGVEKWLCEIKNFVAGIFMPSQDKLNQLYSTIGNFKTKFPFNYVLEVNRFFGDIKESLTEEKGIPITILGSTKAVDFSIWSKTGEVGGMAETIGNMVKDFMTLVLVICFAVWLLFFIKRFWS